MRFNSLGQIATDDRGAAVCGWLEDAVVGPYQRDTGGDKWQMVTRTGTTVTPLPGVVGGCNAVASADGQWMRRLDSANPKLFGSHPWTPADGYVGDMDGDTAITLDDTNRWLSIFVAGAKVSEYRRGSAFGGLRLKGSIASWVEFPDPPIIAFPGPYVVARDVILNTPIPVQVIGAAQYTPVVFRHSTGVWAIYQTDELGGVCHRVDDATQGYIFGVAQSIYDPDVLLTDTGCTIGWSVDAGQFQTRTVDIPALGAGMVPLTIAPPVVDNFGPVSAPVPDGTDISDLAVYIIGVPSLWPRDGTHPMHQVIAGPLIHQCKFSAQAAPLRDRYETWGLDAEWVHHVEDASPDVPYAFTNTRWFPRRMRVGLAHVHQSDRDDAVFRDRGTCGEVNRVGFHDRTWVEDAWDRFDCGPELGIRRVVAVVWDNTDGVYAHDRGIEVNWFGEGVGWLRWEYHRSDIVMASGTPVFSDASRVHRSDFYRVTGQPWTPKLTGCAPPMTPLIPPVPPMPVTTDRLMPGDLLRVDVPLVSQDGRFRLLYQSDGNLVLYAPTGPLWASGTHGQPGFCAMQGDGNFVVYNKAGQPRWASNTNGKPGAWLLVQNDGNMVIYSVTGKALWASNTAYQPPQPVPPIPPMPIPAVVKFPALMASYYAAATDPDVDMPRLGQFFRDCKVTGTRAWLLDAWAIGQRDTAGHFLKGQYDGLIPVVRRPDGRFNLDQWNGAYFTRLRTFVELMNLNGVFCHLTLLELYTWSERKAPLPFVPEADLGPYRHNVNGVHWGDPDDPTFFSLPDVWLTSFYAKVIDTLRGLAWLPEIGNEMPEKDLHTRSAAALRAAGWTQKITVNRQDDTPGQYANMKIGIDYDLIALHGKLNLNYLDENYQPATPPAGSEDEDHPDHGWWKEWKFYEDNPQFKTFRTAWPTMTPQRVILSSDGGGGNPSLHSSLRAVALDVFARGGSYEHQLGLKRNRFYGDGSLRMADLELDRAFLVSLAPHVPS